MSGANQRTPLPRFAFHVHKSKARKIANMLSKSAQVAGYDMIVVDTMAPLQDRIGMFYGVVPESYAAFRYYMLEGRAVYLDNGWASTDEKPTFRFSWNSVQPFLDDLVEPKYPFHPETNGHPKLERNPEPDLALLVLQSEAYYRNLKLPYTRDTWVKATSRFLTAKGYRIEIREKPTKMAPEHATLAEQFGRAGIVVSLNSTVCLQSLLQGIPSYCLLDCTLSPYAPIRLPDIGKAAPPPRSEVLRLYSKLVYNDIPKFDLLDPKAITRINTVPKANRRGYWYHHG